MSSQLPVASMPLSRAPQSAQVIVIGNGLAAVHAALEVHEAGLTCILLESEGWTDGLAQGTTPIDGTKHPQTSRLLRSLGIDLPKPQSSGDCSPRTNGSVDILCEDENDQRSFNRVKDNLQGLSQGFDVNTPSKLMPNYGTMSVHELVVSHGATKRVQAMAEQWVAAIFGVSSKNVSAIYFLLFCKSWGGFEEVLSAVTDSNNQVNEYSLRPLASSVRDEIKSKLSSRAGSAILSQTVRRIDQSSGSKCVLTTASGDVFACSKVIFAAGPASYRAIDFEPSLNEDKRWLQTPDVEGSAYVIRDTPASEVDGLHSLTLTPSGQGQWQGQLQETEAGRDEKVLLLGSTTTALDRDTPYCLAVPATRLGNLERDQWRPEGSVHFVGADTSYSWKGHIEGALASASRGVCEVVDALCSEVTGIPAARL